jgi:hypothetical protein
MEVSLPDNCEAWVQTPIPPKKSINKNVNVLEMNIWEYHIPGEYCGKRCPKQDIKP